MTDDDIAALAAESRSGGFDGFDAHNSRDLIADVRRLRAELESAVKCYDWANGERKAAIALADRAIEGWDATLRIGGE